MVNITLKSGIVTLVIGAVVAGLDYVIQNSPQYAAEAGFVVAILTAFLSFEGTSAPTTTTTTPAASNSNSGQSSLGSYINQLITAGG